MISPAEQKPELDKYELAEEIGHGGMATVYRARDRRLERDVAVKVIHRHLRENNEVAARFASEARAVAKVKHPNIVEVYDVSGDNEEERYLVVELVGGTTLRKLLLTHGHMPPEVAAALALELAAGLQHAHDQGVIHRDVKPENVLVEPPRADLGARSSQERSVESRLARVKITDFGIAKLLDAQGVTSTGQVLGSPAHMAPEQIEGGEVTVRADVFGLGVLLYECMVGKLPFDGKNPAQVLRRVLEGSFTPPERARPTVGARYSRIIEKALARDALDRWASAAELADELNAELARLGFDDPRRELAEYLSDPKAYWDAYEPRLIERLTERAQQARRERNAPLAAADFNRALALRPDNAELLADVAGLARRERLARHLRRGALIGGVGIAVGVAAFAGTSAYKRIAAERAALPAAPPAVTTALKPEAKTPPPAPASPPSAQPPEPEADEALETRRLRAPRSQRPAQPAEPQTRKVSVRVIGAMGTQVRIDGKEIDWLGPPFDLAVGSHRFEFIPPNSQCCLAPPPKSIEVPPGTDVLTISETVRFKPAIIRLTGPPGTQADCLAHGQLSGPGELAVDVRKATRYHCSVYAPPSEGKSPKEFDGTLEPGGTFAIAPP